MTKKLLSMVGTWALLGVCSVRPAMGQSAVEPEDRSPRAATADPFSLGPPLDARPLLVRFGFQLHNLTAIDEQAETFSFSGVLTTEWKDARQAFDPVAAGVDEKVYLGEYQFNELATGWFPQIVLVNDAGSYDTQGVMLRVRPDGTQTVIQTLSAVAKTDLNLRRFPLDRQRLEAVFEVLGYDASEVALQAPSDTTRSLDETVGLPQWSIEGMRMSTQDRNAPYAGHRGVASALVVSIDVQRESFFITRLVIAPLVMIVLLSFSVFWMDRSALADRVSVSFIGILTGVAYQLVMSEILPRISYVTLVHGIISMSFFTMCGGVVINLVLGALDRNGKSELADRIDRRCRWLFPLGYFALLVLMLAIALIVF